jgi:hypothetical protein
MPLDVHMSHATPGTAGWLGATSAITDDAYIGASHERTLGSWQLICWPYAIGVAGS